MTTCIIRVREIHSPIMHTPRGFRVEAALPNMAGTTPNGAQCPSFNAPWYITHFGDFTDMVDVLAGMPHAGRVLRELGFTDIRMA